MTQTPASRPCGLETTPPISFAPIGTAAASFCGCARAGADTPANNATAATSIGSLFLIFMSPSLPAPAGPALFQQDLPDLRKIPGDARSKLYLMEGAGSQQTPCWREQDSNPRSSASVNSGRQQRGRVIASCRSVARDRAPEQASRFHHPPTFR